MPVAARIMALKQSAAYFIRQAYHAQDAVRLWQGWCDFCEKNKL